MSQAPVVPWSRLFHAYGPADDVIELLSALRRGDESNAFDLWQQPYSFLWSGLYCQGRLTPATAPALRYLARAVTQPEFGGGDPTLREGVLWCFREVARTLCVDTDLDQERRIAAGRDAPAVAAWLDGYLRQQRSIFDWTEADAPGRVLLAAALVDCFDLLPELFLAARTLLQAQHPPRLRMVAASAAAMLVRHPLLTADRAAVLEYHLAACADPDPYIRGSAVLGVGELGGVPRAWLTDRHLGVRVCAALAPTLGSDPTAVGVLVAAAREPAAFDTIFGTLVLPQLGHHAPALVTAVCQRVSSFDRLVEDAVAAVPYGSCWVPARDGWHRGVLAEPYLSMAFPAGLPDLGATNAAQRAVAVAMVGWEPPWRGDADWAATFARTSLPAERSAWFGIIG